MKFKKIVSLMSCAVLTATMMFGCGNSQQSSSNGTKTEKPTELVWYAIGAEPTDLNQVLEKVNDLHVHGLEIILEMQEKEHF